MATKQEFLGELDMQIATFNNWLSEISTDIATQRTAIEELKRVRNLKFDTVVNEFLPDLQPHTIARLQQILPGFTSISKIERFRADEERRLRESGLELYQRYHLDTFDEQKMELEAAIDRLNLDREHFKQAYDEFHNLPEFTNLINANYGSDSYTVSWLTDPIDYIQQWRAGDAIVEKLGREDWSEVFANYSEIKNQLQEHDEKIHQKQRQMNDLYHAAGTYKQLVDERNNLDAGVLEKLQIQFRAQLEAQHPLPAVLAGVAEIDEKILAHSQAITNLHPQREKINDQLNKLQQIRAQASQSRRQDIPEDFVAKIRAQRQATATVEQQRRTYSQNRYYNNDEMLIVDHNHWYIGDYYYLSDDYHHTVVDHFVETVNQQPESGHFSSSSHHSHHDHHNQSYGSLS